MLLDWQMSTSMIPFIWWRLMKMFYFNRMFITRLQLLYNVPPFTTRIHHRALSTQLSTSGSRFGTSAWSPTEGGVRAAWRRPSRCLEKDTNHDSDRLSTINFERHRNWRLPEWWRVFRCCTLFCWSAHVPWTSEPLLLLLLLNAAEVQYDRVKCGVALQKGDWKTIFFNRCCRSYFRRSKVLMRIPKVMKSLKFQYAMNIHLWTALFRDYQHFRLFLKFSDNNVSILRLSIGQLVPPSWVCSHQLHMVSPVLRDASWCI